MLYRMIHRFPNSSVGKESACNAGDLGSIPGSGRSTGEGMGYPLQYSWVSLVAQVVRNPPAMWEIWIQSLDWEDLLEKGKATHSSILAWRIPWTVKSMGSQRVRHDWATFTFTCYRKWDGLYWQKWNPFHLNKVAMKDPTESNIWIKSWSRWGS